jgi:hypothetical protein
MSSLSLLQASTHPYLTSYANSVIGEDIQKIAGLIDIIAPRVPVLGRTFRYTVHSNKVAMQVQETLRGLGQRAARVAYGTDSTEATLQTHGLDVAIDDQERRNSEGLILSLEKAKLNTLTKTATRSLLQKVVTAANNALGAASGGNWSSAAVDPVAEIDAAMLAIHTASNLLPSHIIFGLSAWNTFRNNAKFLARFSGVEVQAINPMMLEQRGMFLNPQTKIVIADQAYDSAALGLAASITRFLGATAWLIYNNPTPDENDASFMKNFYNVNTGILTVGQLYRDAAARSDILPVDWDSLVVATNSAAGSKFTVT